MISRSKRKHLMHLYVPTRLSIKIALDEDFQIVQTIAKQTGQLSTESKQVIGQVTPVEACF